MRGGGYRGRGTPPVPSSDEDAEVGAELGERGGTRAVLEEEDDLFTRAAASLVEGAAAGGAHARTMPMAAIRWAYRLGRLLLALTEMSDVAKRC